MREWNFENGRNPSAPGRALGRKAELGIFLEKLDRVRQSQWQKLLNLQAEQLRLLASLIESRRPGPREMGPVMTALSQHRNARERSDAPRPTHSVEGLV
jgi:hypothetical protein